jgi:DNA-binding NarL/FixJ family response regulator
VHTNSDLFCKAVKLGCRGYVSKDASLVEILSAVRAVRNGQFYFPPEMQASLGEKPATAPEPARTVAEQLTPSERRIMRLITAGKSRKKLRTNWPFTAKP